MDAVFLDTNSIRNGRTKSFFGNIDMYQRLADQVQIIIPTIVIEEIKQQKRRYLISQLNKFRENYFTKYLELDSGETLFNHIDSKIQELYNNANDEISHIEWDMEPDGKLEKIKELAVKSIPPFQGESDKGFKDSYIYFTILDYCEKAKDDIFIITHDERLRKAFEETDVIVLSSTEEYYKYREEYFKEEYFIKKLRDRFENNNINAESILKTELSENEDWQLTILVGDIEQILNVDFVSKEILD